MQTLKARGPEASGIEWVRLLFEVTRCLVQFDSIEEVVPAVLNLVSAAMPLRTAVLIADIGEGSVVRAWRAEGVPEAALAKAEAEARVSYRRYFDEGGLTGTSKDESSATAAPHRIGGLGSISANDPGRMITLPLAMTRRQVFGALQIEPSEVVDENQLIVLNTLVNQLAVALDRFAAARRELRARMRAQSIEKEAATLRRREEAAREKAQAAIRARDHFLAVVSHDLNDLVGAASQANHDLLKMPIATDPDWRRRLEVFDRSVTQMRSRLEGLGDAAAEETGRGQGKS